MQLKAHDRIVYIPNQIPPRIQMLRYHASREWLRSDMVVKFIRNEVDFFDFAETLGEIFGLSVWRAEDRLGWPAVKFIRP